MYSSPVHTHLSFASAFSVTSRPLMVALFTVMDAMESSTEPSTGVDGLSVASNWMSPPKGAKSPSACASTLLPDFRSMCLASKVMSPDGPTEAPVAWLAASVPATRRLDTVTFSFTVILLVACSSRLAPVTLTPLSGPAGMPV